MAAIKYLWDVDTIDPADTTRFGGKASGLARMRQMGLPVPPAVVISTDAFKAFRENGGLLPASLGDEIDTAIHLLEQRTGKAFCGRGVPLLLSVRSGAKISMPGMMDTILNLGLDARSAAAFAASSGDRAFVGDTWLRFWSMYADTVLGVDAESIVPGFAETLLASGDADAGTFASVEAQLLAEIEAEAGERPSPSPREQLSRAVIAVFESWESARAKAYRKHHGISDELGTAVVIQAMVFGNLDAESGTGVAFTRDPMTGERRLFGEYLAGHQGEDLVAGTKTPESLSAPTPAVARIAEEVRSVGDQLEQLYHDALDIEFTVERGKLHLLQVRAAKRTAAAAVRIAVEMADEGLIDRESALRRVSDDQLRQLVRPGFVPASLAAAEGRLLLEGVGASPGHCTGVAVLDSDRAVERAASGEAVILVRPTTSPLDVRGMLHSQGIVTARGGSASHAAVVARALDKPCVVGCGALAVDEDARTFTVGERTFREGDTLSVDGKTGRIYVGAIELDDTGASNPYLNKLLGWAEALSGVSVWASARLTGELGAIVKRHPAGVGVVPVVDLLIGSGQAEGLIGAVQALSANAAAPAAKVEDRFRDAVIAVCTEFLGAARGHDVALRLPRLSGSRARHMVDGWASLEPGLLLPLGAPRLTNTVIEGVAKAMADVEHARVTVVLPAVLDVLEIAAFAKAVDAIGGPKAGILVQNAALLAELPNAAVEGVDIWIDIPELVRTFHGWPDEMSFSAEVIDRYEAAGHLSFSPLNTLKGFLLTSLAQLAVTARDRGWRVVLELGASPSTGVVNELYGLGYRQFSVLTERIEPLRLGLGHAAGGSNTKAG
ncbi:pyruvate, phosphate dikinase [Paraburkholderia sp. J12]|uniref:pyruvate, phosphate dikinase n=1 Tax=Paraburkholderia sp. J12 TaxID=2805432 RepID=UPI002ABD73BC|nr:pyruvate, phosphate dikinase [Paraburkholderia sp. J12]